METFQRLLKFVILLLILLFYLIDKVNSWNLSSVFGINSSNIPIKHITILKNKAYVSIPRISDLQEATFLQLPWPENLQKDNTNVNIYPRKDLQVIGECDGLQSVVCSDVDTSGRLYILDAGYANCPPKIVIYEGVGFKKVIGTIIELFNVNGSNLNSIIIDPFGVGGPRAYIGDTSNEIIIVYSFRDEHWWAVKLLYPADSENFLKNHLKIQPQQFALSKNKPILYFTSNNSEYLFSVNAVHLRTMLTPPEELCDNISIGSEKIQVTFLGEKLGPSNGLATDGRFGLYYYIPRDYVVVRWDSRYPLIAENHEVLTQSAEILPTVEQLFYDNQNTLWALLGLPNADGNHCTKIQIK